MSTPSTQNKNNSKIFVKSLNIQKELSNSINIILLNLVRESFGEFYILLYSALNIEELISSDTTSAPKSKTSVVSSTFVICRIDKTISPLI